MTAQTAQTNANKKITELEKQVEKLKKVDPTPDDTSVSPVERALRQIQLYQVERGDNASKIFNKFKDKKQLNSVDDLKRSNPALEDKNINWDHLQDKDGKPILVMIPFIRGVGTRQQAS